MQTSIRIEVRIANSTGTKTVCVEGLFDNLLAGLTTLLTEVAGCVTNDPLTITVNQPEPVKTTRSRK